MLTASTRPRQFDLSSLPLHPILAAAYPALFLFATNAADQITAQPLWIPLLRSVGAATATLVVLGLLMKDWQRAGLLTTVLVIGFFGWPCYYMVGHHDPDHVGKRPDMRDKVIVHDVLILSHSASLDLAFYDGHHFPE